MLNIHICGFRHETTQELRVKIEKVIQCLSLEDSSVVLAKPGELTSCVRVSSCDLEMMDCIVAAFKEVELGVDMQLIYARVIPAEEMR